jgi:hypothetical protein
MSDILRGLGEGGATGGAGAGADNAQAAVLNTNDRAQGARRDSASSCVFETQFVFRESL